MLYSATAQSISGVVFDMDGTLVDSGLDFAKMRAEIGIPKGQSVLEYVEGIEDSDRRFECESILYRHEMEGAERSILIPGVERVLREFKKQNIPLAVLTRNKKVPTELSLKKTRIFDYFSQVLTRECAPPKPDPRALVQIFSAWNVEISEGWMVGDYLFDIQAGKNAGMRTALFISEGPKPVYADQADLVFRKFEDLIPAHFADPFI